MATVQYSTPNAGYDQTVYSGATENKWANTTKRFEAKRKEMKRNENESNMKQNKGKAIIFPTDSTALEDGIPSGSNLTKLLNNGLIENSGIVMNGGALTIVA